MDRHEMTSENVWTFLESGCNSEEIAAYAGVSRMTAVAMMESARHAHVAGIRAESRTTEQEG